jgi:hypothetical protein
VPAGGDQPLNKLIPRNSERVCRFLIPEALNVHQHDYLRFSSRQITECPKRLVPFPAGEKTQSPSRFLKEEPKDPASARGRGAGFGKALFGPPAGIANRSLRLTAVAKQCESGLEQVLDMRRDCVGK